MISPIRYEVISDDGLKKETYRYWFLDREMQLVLDGYEFEQRKTTRHKWQLVARWNRNRMYGDEIYREQVPQREEVRQAVLKQFIERITIE